MGTDDESLIVSAPAILGGKPCIRGTRISVQHVLEFLASGQSREDFLVAFPHVGGDRFEAALRYAASNVQRYLAG